MDESDIDAEFGSPTSVDSVSYFLQGTIATKVGDAYTTVPLDQTPVPTDQLCSRSMARPAAETVGRTPSDGGTTVCRAR